MPEKNDYRQRLIEWSVAHPGQLWADTPEAAAARKWMQINAADDFRSLYWNEDEKTRSGIDRRFLPKGVEQEVYNEGIREATNTAAPYVAGALVGSAGLAAGLGALPMMPQMGSGLMKAGNAVARGIDFVGRAAMPSAVLSGSAVAPYADAAALSYWSAKGLQAANEMRKNGRWGSAAALGAVSSMPMLMPLGMKGMRMYNIAKNARVTPQEVLAEPFAESVVSQPVIQSKMVEVPAPYEIGDLGGGYMLKSLMRGNPLEKQISKQGTVSVNNIKALMNKGSKVEQAVVDKILSSEEFAGKKAVDYNKFRKAVQDELITYERTPDIKWDDYGLNRLGLYRQYNSEDFSEFLKESGYIARWTENGSSIEYYNPATGDIKDYTTFHNIYDEHAQKVGAKLNTFTFSSPRIPMGSAKHYNENTLGHSRTYTTADEPDVLHVMESQSDWAQQSKRGKIAKDAEKASLEYKKDIDRANALFEENVDIEKKLAMGIRPDGTNIEHDYEYRDIREIIERNEQTRNNLLARAKKYDMAAHPDKYVQESYLQDNYTSRQIQENLRYAAEKGQKKMRYPTRETAAKIEGYPEREAYYNEAGEEIGNTRYTNEPGDIKPAKLFTYGEAADKEIAQLQSELRSLRDYVDSWENLPPQDPLDEAAIHDSEQSFEALCAYYKYNAKTSEWGKKNYERESKLFEQKFGRKPNVDGLIKDFEDALDKSVSLQYRLYKLVNQNTASLRPGIIKKTVYDKENESVLKHYMDFPKQYQKLFKGSDVRTVTDPKGNTWYEVDVPDNYLKQEWQYASGGDLNDKSGTPVLWDPSNIIITVPAGNVREEPTIDDLVAYSSLRRIPTKNIDYFEQKDEDFRQARFNMDEKHLIPFIPSKSVVLTNAGKVASGAKISTNVLDSLAKYGALAGISPVDALGVSTRETTLGLYPGNFLWKPSPFLPKEHTFHGQNKLADEGVVSPAEIINNDSFYTSPYNDAIAWAGRTIGGVGSAGDARVRYHRNPVTDVEMDAALAKSRAYSDRLARRIDMNEHPLLHGFRLFRDKKFNVGEPGYEEHVRQDGEDVFKSPEVQAWWNKEGKNWYNGTRFEKNPLLKTIFVGEPGYELAGGGGIHIKPENRGKFTALLKRTGKSASWFKEHGTPLQKKRATFALNARKWKHGDGGYIERFGYDAVSEAVRKIKGYK